MIVDIKFIFSKNNKIGSKLISWGSSFLPLKIQKIPSHVAILINDQIVLESVLGPGCRMVPYDSWKEINQELYKVNGDSVSLDLITKFYHDNWGVGYDYKGILYFSYALLFHKFFKTPVPKINKWNDPEKMFCTEIAGKLKNIDTQMMTPAKFCETLLEASGQLDQQPK